MDMYDIMFSTSGMLNDQMARQIFGILPEDGPLVVIRDRAGNCWPSRSDDMNRLGLGEAYITEVCDRIDDGAEPVITEHNGCGIVAAQISTERTPCGYIILAWEGYPSERILNESVTFDIILSMVSLVARLIEQNNQLFERQIRLQSTVKEQ